MLEDTVILCLSSLSIQCPAYCFIRAHHYTGKNPTLPPPGNLTGYVLETYYSQLIIWVKYVSSRAYIPN